MRVLLIHPLHEKPGRQRELRDRGRDICFPLGIGYIAAVLRQAGHQVACWDIHAENLFWEEIEAKLPQFEFDLVGISAISTQYRYVKKLAQVIKQHKDVPIVVGGALATYSARVVLEHCPVDFCVIGEGELTTVELLGNLDRPERVRGVAWRDGRVVRVNEARDYIEDLGQLPMPAYDLFDMDFYISHAKKMKSSRPDGQGQTVAIERLRGLRTGYVIGGRGCPYQCRFCSRNFRGFRIRPLAHLMAEILHLRDNYGVQFIHLGDELVTLNKRTTLEFCRAMKETGLKWDCQSRVNVVDEEMLVAMKDAGCVTIGYGIESGSQKLLDAMKKATTVEQVERAMRWAMKLDFDIKAQLMFGFPGESRGTLKETIDLFARIGHPGRGFSFYTVLPGTEIYDWCVASGRIADEDRYLTDLAECVSGERVLFNFTHFADEEIFPRIRWARVVMRRNACADSAKRAELAEGARARLKKINRGPVGLLIGRLRQRPKVRAALEHLATLSPARAQGNQSL